MSGISSITGTLTESSARDANFSRDAIAVRPYRHSRKRDSAQMLPRRNGVVSISRIMLRKLERLQLAVQGGAADSQPAGDFRHLPAVMGDGKADDLGLQFVERAHLRHVVKQGQPVGSKMRGVFDQQRLVTAELRLPVVGNQSRRGGASVVAYRVTRAGEIPAVRSPRFRPGPRRGRLRSRAGARYRATRAFLSSAMASPDTSFHRLSLFRAKADQEVPDEVWNVLATRPQRRHRDRKHMQPVE
jgi:hypothetical protein